MSVPMNFTYKDYGKLLKHARKIAPIYTLAQWDGQNGTILRHDVDFSIRSAYEMSAVEEKLGIRSTFFVMASNCYYNVLFPKNSELLSKMADNGFEIGLHFDPSIYGDMLIPEITKRMKFECRVIESASGVPVKSVSLHNPSLNGMYPMFKGYRNAYSKEIFSDGNYLSDSCMGFRGKDPFEFAEKAAKMPVQMVFHPMHWSESGGNYTQYFTRYVLGLTDEIDDTFRANTGYKKEIGRGRLRNAVKRELNGGKKD